MASDRRFLAVPPKLAEAESARRIWEVEPGAILVALGVLVEPRELQTLFLDVETEDRSGDRDDLVLQDAVRRCAAPCPFAEAIERLLDVRTEHVRLRVGGSPMGELAAWWLGVKDAAQGPQLTALLWSLARDRRWIVRPLLDMVRGDIWVRALRLLGERADFSRPVLLEAPGKD